MDTGTFKMDKKSGITNGLCRETLNEYMDSYGEQEAKIGRFAKGNQYAAYYNQHGELYAFL